MTQSAPLLLSIFASDILPIFVIAGVGFLLARFADVGARPLSRVTFNALAPCLVFNMLMTSPLGRDDFGRIAAFCLLTLAASGLAARLAAAALGLDRPSRIAFLLVVMFSNSGNYGLPVALFAFGPEALTFATVYFVISSILTYTLGVFLAASGRRSVADALAGVVRVPTVYAVAAAALFMLFGSTPPAIVMRPIEMLSNASLPLMILVLGMQLERAVLGERPAVIATAVALSLFVTPAMAFGIARLLDLSGPALQASLLQASMPAAVITTILALQYEVAPSLVTNVVFVSTVLSPLTLTVLIALLKRL